MAKAVAEFLNGISRYTDILSPLVYILDNDFWHRAYAVCQHLGLEAKTLITHGHEIFSNTMLIKNKTSTVHWDPLDAVDGFSAITAFEQFESGELCFPDLGLKFPHQPGDIMLFRSAYLRHYLAPVYDGDCYAMIRFIHEQVMSYIEESNML